METVEFSPSMWEKDFMIRSQWRKVVPGRGVGEVGC